jgi:hypothetical protein
MFGLVVMDHCQDYNLVGKGVMHEGAVSTELGLPGWPAIGEEIIVARKRTTRGIDGHTYSLPTPQRGRKRAITPRGAVTRNPANRRSLSASHRSHRRVDPGLRYKLQDEPAAAITSACGGPH